MKEILSEDVNEQWVSEHFMRKYSKVASLNICFKTLKTLVKILRLKLSCQQLKILTMRKKQNIVTSETHITAAFKPFRRRKKASKKET